MAETLGQTATAKVGPLPIWGWLAVGGAGIGGILYYRKKKAAAAAQQAAQNQTPVASNLGTVPVSNLTTQAQPMPLQLGDTFVNTPGTTQTVAPSPSPVQKAPYPNAPPNANLTPAALPSEPPAPVPSPMASGGVQTG